MLMLKISTMDITKAQKDIDEIESGIKNNDSLINKMFALKRDVVRHLAECYEVLVIAEKITIQTSEIANFLMKKLEKLNADITKVWVYDSLPAKYKSHRPSQLPELGNFTANSSHGINYTEENKLEINFLTLFINLLKKRRTALKNEPFYSKLEPEQYMEHYIIKSAALNMVENVWNNRKTVPVNTIHLLLQVFDTYNLKYAAGQYISELKKFGSEKKEHAINILDTTFSAKQLRKILRGQTRELHVSMEIRTQNEAYENGFFGKAQCTKCNSWRIILNSKYSSISQNLSESILYCFACGNTDGLPFVKLPLSSPTPRITEEKTL